MNPQPGGMATNQSNICYKCSRRAPILSSIRGWITKLLLARRMFDNSSRRVPRWRVRPPETQRLRLDEALSEKTGPCDQLWSRLTSKNMDAAPCSLQPASVCNLEATPSSRCRFAQTPDPMPAMLSATRYSKLRATMTWDFSSLRPTSARMTPKYRHGCTNTMEPLMSRQL